MAARDLLVEAHFTIYLIYAIFFDWAFYINQKERDKVVCAHDSVANRLEKKN
jgi:hypothetical protein